MKLCSRCRTKNDNRYQWWCPACEEPFWKRTTSWMRAFVYALFGDAP